MRGTTKITGEVILCGLPRREKLERCLLPNMIENLQKYGFIVFRGLINMEITKIIPAKELLSNGWWLYCSNCGTRVQNDTATVLDAVEVLCDECAKDWNEKRGKK